MHTGLQTTDYTSFSLKILVLVFMGSEVTNLREHFHRFIRFDRLIAKMVYLAVPVIYSFLVLPNEDRFYARIHSESIQWPVVFCSGRKYL